MVGLPCLEHDILRVVGVVLSLDGRTEVVQRSFVLLHVEVGASSEEECLRVPLNSKYSYQRIGFLTWIGIACITQQFEHVVQSHLFSLM